MKIKLGSTFAVLVVSALVACSTTQEEKTGTSEHAAVADIDHMIRRADGTFDVYCADGTVEHNVPASKITANDVCHVTPPPPVNCPGTTTPPAAVWNPPGAAQTTCTAADITLLQQQANAGASVSELEAAVFGQNATCAQCIFSDQSDTRWGVLVYSGNDGEAFVNWGACFATAPNGSAACGAAFHKTHTCSLDICNECTTQETYSACYGNSFGNATTCGQYDTTTNCGGNYAAIDTACATVWDAIKFACGGN